MTWRSETLKALTATPEREELHTKQVRRMAKYMFESLSQTFPKLFGNPGCCERFYHQVMISAAKLGSKIQTSSSIYKLQMAENPAARFGKLKTEFIKQYSLLDNWTRITLKSTSAVVADEEGVFGQIVIPLEPGLYRVNQGKEDTTLRKEVYLVELDEPLVKRK